MEFNLKRLLSFAVAFVMVLTMVPFDGLHVHATTGEGESSGSTTEQEPAGTSNVPAAVLLSAFTDQWRELLAGVNIGGLGTPIASLASLISLKLYAADKEANSGKFLAVFTLANIAGLAALLTFSALT